MNIKKERKDIFMKSVKLLVTLMTAGILFTGCGFKDNQTIIKINNHRITQGQYTTLMNKAVANSPIAGLMGNVKANKDGLLYLVTSQRVLNQLVVQELLNQEAEKRGVKVSNKDLNEAISEIVEKVGGKDQLAAILKQNGVSSKDFKNDLKFQIKMKKLAQAAGDIKISDKDCEQYYKKNPNKFKNPEQVRASHILISANPYQIQEELTKGGKEKITEKDLTTAINKKMEEQKTLAKKISKELKADKSKFAQYAKKYSQDPMSAKNGGDLGFFDKEKMVPEFSKAAFSAKPNTVSDPVETQYGYHIIIVTDRKAAGVIPYQKAKSDIKDFLSAQKEIEILDNLIESSKKNAEIEYVSDEYNPEEVGKKVDKQMGGLKDQLQKSKTPEKNKKSKKSKK